MLFPMSGRCACMARLHAAHRSSCRIAIAACRARPASASRTMARRARSILKSLCPIALGVAQQHVGGLREMRSRSARLPAQRRFGCRIAPRLVRDAAEREARLLDRAAVKLERRRDRDQRERIGQPVADLQIGVVRAQSPARGSSIGRDDLVAAAGWCRAAACRRAADGNRQTRCARSPAGPVTCTLASSAASATHMSDGCVAMQASLVPRMALMRLMPFDRRAAAAGLRACCRASRCHRNRSSACAAGDCRRSTPCCAVAARRRPGSRSTAADSAARSAGDRRGRCSARARRCAGRRPAFPRRLQRQTRDVDQPRRPLDIVLHQVDQIGAAGDELGRRIGGDLADGVGDVGWRARIGN